MALKINWCLQILYLEALVHSQHCFMNFCTNLSLERKENVENINADILMHIKIFSHHEQITFEQALSSAKGKC